MREKKERTLSFRSISLKQIIFRVLITVFLLSILGGLYWIESKIPKAIIVANVDIEAIQTDYKDLILSVDEYEESDSFCFTNGSRITAKHGFEQMLSYTLQERYPEGYVRNLSLERKMRLFSIEFIACILVLELFIWLICSKRAKNQGTLRFLLHILGFFLLCFLIKYEGVVPTTWIPEKLIDLNAWNCGIEEYNRKLDLMGKIPCIKYLQYEGMRRILQVAFCVSFLLSIGRLILFECVTKSKNHHIVN